MSEKQAELLDEQHVWSLKEEVRKECLSVIDQFTVHGFPNIFRARTLFMKVFWLIIFLLSTSACTWLTIEAIMDYFNYDVVAKIRIQNEIPFVLPMITICNINQIGQTNELETLNYESNLDYDKFFIDCKFMFVSCTRTDWVR